MFVNVYQLDGVTNVPAGVGEERLFSLGPVWAKIGFVRRSSHLFQIRPGGKPLAKRNGSIVETSRVVHRPVDALTAPSILLTSEPGNGSDIGGMSHDECA